MRLFNRITLLTPESVELEFTLAGIGNRALALTIDYLIWYLFLAIVLVFTAFLLDTLDLSLALLPGGTSNPELWIFAIMGLIFFFVYIGYFVFFETLWHGQTPGKKRSKIRVIRDDGKPIGLQQATLRSLLRPVDDFLFIGAFMIMLEKRERRVGDWIAGTLVVQEEEAVTAAEFLVSDTARDLADRLWQAADLSGLSPDDFAAIREYLRRRSTLFPDAKKQIARQLTQKAKSAIALERIPKGVTADRFLEAVYLAYQKRE